MATKAEDSSTAETTKKFSETATIERAVVGVEQGPPHPIVKVGTSQRFRRLRLHSRGGLGAVFVALDTELNREVALKQILDPHADNPVNRSRFLVEAEITGWLEHPGIAPVYSLGADENGRPYYAMRFIRGESLREAVDRFHSQGGRRADPGHRSLEFQKLLRQFLDVCNTVEYAHSRGVIHRDIKPSNVVVGRHGETMLVDWGLAKFIGREDQDATKDPGEETPTPHEHEDRHETIDGTALGTPAYMSPEQADGRAGAVGFPSDVYSLGATLYYLLTGRPPLVGRDIMDVLHKLRIGEFPPPRQVNRLAPAALEAVALKAMALRPIDRYASARSLAEDIEHWLAAEPVSAWREPILGRARRWWRRHPRLSGAAGAATVVALVILAGATLVLREYSRSEALAHSQAESHLVLAIESVAEFGSRFTDDPRIKARGLETFRRDLLLRARDFYRAIARELKGGNDPRLRAESGRIFLRIARITLELGSYAEAREAAELAIEAFTRLKRERTGEESFAEGLAQSIECRGDVAVREFQFETARRSFQDAQAVWESLCLARPLVLSYRLGQASSLTRLGKVLNFQEDLPSAEAALRRGLKLCDGDEPSSREVRADLLEYLGQVQLARGLDRPRDSQEFSASLGAARETLEECLEIRSRLRAESPHDPKALSGFIKTFTTFATVCCNARQPAPVEGRLGEVRAIAEDLLREHPDVPDSKGMLAWCDAIHAICLAQLGQHERASDAAETAFSEAPTYGPAVYYATLGLCFAAEAPGADRQAAERYLDRAMVLLRNYCGLGEFQNPIILRELRTGEDFHILRGREDFKKLLAEVEASAKPGG